VYEAGHTSVVIGAPASEALFVAASNVENAPSVYAHGGKRL
jgi:hypothetical protein